MTEYTRVLLEKDRSIVVASQDDVEGVLEHNKKLRSITQRSDWGRHVASIPPVICVKWLNEEWQRGNTQLRFLSPEWDLLVRDKLNDPEWKYLRTDK